MRKKLKMRQACKPAKFAEGGPIRTRGRGISQGLRQRQPLYDHESEAPVAPRAAPAEMSYDLRAPAVAGAGLGGVGAQPEALPLPPPEPPASPPRQTVARRSTSRRAPELTADDLNEREMTRILNERSLAAAQAGRNMYAKGGLVKPRKKGKC